MWHPFPEPDVDLKVQWANGHRERLLDRIKAFREREPYSIREDRRELNAKPYRVLVAHSAERVPDEIPLLLGDLLNNLRATLDYLVGAMRPNGPSDKSAFPITNKGRKRFEEVSRTALDGIPDPAKKRVEGMQPYHRGRPGWKRQSYWALEVLERLWNIDKHRSLLLAVSLLSPQGVGHNRTGEDASGIGFRMPRRQHEAEIWLPIDDRDQHFEPKFGVEVALTKPRGFTRDWMTRYDRWELDGLVESMYRVVQYRVLPELREFVQPRR